MIEPHSVSGNELIVIGVSADPDPVDAILYVYTKRTIVLADTYRPEIADPLEVKRGVPGVGLEQLVIFIRKFADFAWERPVKLPELGRRVMLQISRAFPALACVLTLLAVERCGTLRAGA